MSVSKLPSGRYRAQVYDEETGRTLSAGKVLGLKDPTFPNKREAEDAVTDARRRLRQQSGDTEVTVREFWQRWLNEPLFIADLKHSTVLTQEERTRAFVETHGTQLLRDVHRDTVRAWLSTGERNWTVPGLCAMWNAAINPGLLIDVNPWSRLGLKSSKGNRYEEPPTEVFAASMRQAADELTPPGFALWFHVAQFTGMRGGELDALKWDCVDLDAGVVHVRKHYSSRSGHFTAPKNGRSRMVAILPPAEEALRAALQIRSSDFVFVNSREDHWRNASREYYWNKVRKATGWRKSLYLATRHFAGHYLYELCGISSEDVAAMLGHTDGGELVRKLYGHHNEQSALDRIRRAVKRRDNDDAIVTPIRRAA